MSTKIDLGEDKNVHIVDPNQVLKPRVQSSILMEDIAKSPEDALMEARTLVWGSWLNSDPLLIGHVDEEGASHLFFVSENVENKIVLVDFWDYSLLPSVRSLRYMREWHKRYASAGLVCIGVHTPRFEFGKDKANLQNVLRYLDITYPVVMDNEYKLWRTLENRFWPRKTIFNSQHQMVASLVGEGNYEDFEILIQKTLREKEPGLPCPPAYKMQESLDETGVDLFLNPKDLQIWANSPSPITENTEITYKEGDVATKEPNKLYLDGVWVHQKDCLHTTSVSKSATHCKITIYTKAKGLHIVAKARAKSVVDIAQVIKVPVLLNKKPASDENQGEDITLVDSKGSQLQILTPRLYHVLKNMPSNRLNEITMTFDNKLNEVVDLFAFFLSDV